jgi:hypothetical protein
MQLDHEVLVQARFTARVFKLYGRETMIGR